MRYFVSLILSLGLLLTGCYQEPRSVSMKPVSFREAVRTRLEPIPELSIPVGGDSVDQPDLIVTRDMILQPPFYLSPEILLEIKDCIPTTGDESQRYRFLRNCLVVGGNGFTYNPTGTLDAVTCYQRKEGNCFAFTNLFIGAARKSKLNAYYMLVEDIIGNQSEGSTIIHTNHIIAAVQMGVNRVLVDFIPNPREYHYTTVLTDIEAAGLFYNNLAARLLLDNREREAEMLFHVARALYPDSYQIHNNVGVLKLRRGKLDEARHHFSIALQRARFPDLVLGNVLTTYERTGNMHAYEDVQTELENARKRNPYVYISMAKKAFRRGEYENALQMLDTARRIKKEIPEIYSLQMQIYGTIGDASGHREAYQDFLKYNLVATSDDPQQIMP